MNSIHHIQLTLRLNNIQSINSNKTMPSETEGSVSLVINHIDSNIWNQVAIKNIEKMPKPRLAKESNSILTDFVFMHSKLPLKQQFTITQERDSNKKLYERGIAGNATIKEKTMRHSLTEASQEIPKIISNKRVKNQNIKSISQVINLPQKKLNETKNNFFRLFVSNIPEQQQIKKDQILRTTKYEILRYNKNLDDFQRQKRIASEQRYQTQQRKIKQAKLFTYDYQGKVVSVPIKPSSNVKVFNIKPFFKNAYSGQRLNKSNLCFTNKLDPTKTSTIKNKRVVCSQSKLQQEERQGSKFNKLFKVTNPNNMTQIFQNNKEIEMGVSITDLGNNSTISGQKRKTKSRMKLSEFKEMKSQFKPKNRPKQNCKSKQILLQTQLKNQPQNKISKNKEVIDSEASSRLLSSSFSHFFQRTGKIVKNIKLFNESFAEGF